MAIPDSARDEAGNVEQEEGGVWKIDGVVLTIGMPVYAYDERIEVYEFARVTETNDRSMLVTFSDGFRFLFGANRPAIKLHPQFKRALEAAEGGIQPSSTDFSIAPPAEEVNEATDYYYWKGKYEGAIEMARLLGRGGREDGNRD
jgi:hypothetical protein